MTNTITLSKSVFDELSRHANDFEKKHPAILEDSTLVPTMERKKYQQLFNQYGEHLQNLLNNARVIDSNDHRLPFVTIGSVVELENMQNNRTTKIMVTFPLSNPPNPGRIMQASYNSPMGQACFLGKPGETVEVNAPGGVFQYRIKSIILAMPS